MFYADYRQRPLSTFDFNVVLQTSVDPATVIPAARRILAEMAPEMPPRFRTVREAIDASTASRRFTLGLTGFFAGAAMLLALLGVYGVLSYLVEQRRQEFGVRMALGARPSDVRRLVMKEAAWLVVVGLTLGVAGSLAAARVLDQGAVRRRINGCRDVRRCDAHARSGRARRRPVTGDSRDARRSRQSPARGVTGTSGWLAGAVVATAGGTAVNAS